MTMLVAVDGRVDYLQVLVEHSLRNEYQWIILFYYNIYTIHPKKFNLIEDYSSVNPLKLNIPNPERSSFQKGMNSPIKLQQFNITRGLAF